jgi:hypothetical protein
MKRHAFCQKITAKIENKSAEDTYLVGTDLVLSKKEAMEWVKTNRLDAVIIHHKNGSEHLRSRPSHCIWSIQIPEEAICSNSGRNSDADKDSGQEKTWSMYLGIY